MGQAPIGASVLVESATQITVNIGIQPTYDSVNYTVAGIQASIISTLQQYFANLAFAPDNTVYLTKMLAAVAGVPGVINANNGTVTMNGLSADIQIGDQQVATLGTVTFS